jgi:hypothetical protein
VPHARGWRSGSSAYPCWSGCYKQVGQRCYNCTPSTDIPHC